MTEEVFIPQLGQTVEEVTLIEWLVQDGEKVKTGQELLRVETDKANFDVEALASGYIHLGPFEKGAVVPVLTVVAVIGNQEEKFSTGNTPAAGEQVQGKPDPVSTVAPPAVTPISMTEERIFVSPLARRIAQEHGVDLARVNPSGRRGARSVVVAADVRQMLASESRKSTVEAATSNTIKPTPALYPLPVSRRIPLSGVRGVIASRMSLSVQTTARVTLGVEVDATDLVKWRSTLKETRSEEWGFTPGYNDILGYITARALVKYPYMNARINGEMIEYLDCVNLGLAVDTARGLLVPVVKNAHQKNIREFGQNFRILLERARQGKSLPDDLEGGTFTITNLGAYDVDIFTPVINLPEAAILGVGRIVPRMVIDPNRQAVIRDMLTLSLVFDHRLVDGVPAARFMQYIKQTIENLCTLLNN